MPSETERVVPVLTSLIESEFVSGTCARASGNSKDKNEEKSGADSVGIGNINCAAWCLIDHPEIWTKMGPVTAHFRKSSRLRLLMKKQKNEIVQFPDSIALSRQFYCVMCYEIPFPWTGDSANTSGYNPEGIFLCKKGHTLCRSCGQCCFTCTASTIGSSFTRGKGKKNATLTEATLKHVPAGSLRLWGQTQLCFRPITSFNCFFLEDMITETEFACKYFYDWCTFRGKGKNLQSHESECPFRFSSCKVDTINASGSDQDGKQSNNPQLQDDDALILNFKQDVAISETTRLLKMHIPNWDELNPRNRVRGSKKKKVNY